MTQEEKEPKEKLWQIALREKVRVASGKPPNVNTLTVMCGRLIDGERDDWAVNCIVQHGTVNMMAGLHEVGLVGEEHWELWKKQLTPADAELVLEWPDSWPHEVREWAAVVAIHSL